MQKERLRDEIIGTTHRLDYFSLHGLSVFIAGLKGVEAQIKEGEGTDYEDG